MSARRALQVEFLIIETGVPGDGSVAAFDGWHASR